MVKRRRFEVSSYGIDEALQGLSSDPYAATGQSNYTGLRVPPILPGAASQPRYLFCLATYRFKGHVRLLGMRQGLTIGFDGNQGTPPERPVELFVTTPTFRFVDGNVSWHLVRESADKVVKRPQTDTQSWSFLQSDSPAMLYQTFTNSVVNPTTGAPIYYSQGLTAYTPPDIAQQWDPVAGLGRFNDIRFPWQSANGWSSLGNKRGLELDGGGRISLYASVLQTNPATRANSLSISPVAAGVLSGLPEENFLLQSALAPLGAIYWRIMGSLIFEVGGEGP